MPFFIDLLVGIVFIFLAEFAYFQIIRPWRLGEPLFPFFRWSNVAEDIRIVEAKLEQTAEELHLKELQEELKRRKAQLKDNE